MLADARIAAAANLLAEPARAAMLAALADGRALPAGELARCAGITPQTASAHLGRLVSGSLLVVERHGRHRYYRIADPAVVRALEALALLPPATRHPILPDQRVASSLRFARMCYDHLAGELGVRWTEGLLANGTIDAGEGSYRVTRDGARSLEAFGIDAAALSKLRRAFAPGCLDWTERRYHIGGALGRALADQCFTRRWLERSPRSRAVRLTAKGRQGFPSMGVAVLP